MGLGSQTSASESQQQSRLSATVPHPAPPSDTTAGDAAASDHAAGSSREGDTVQGNGGTVVSVGVRDTCRTTDDVALRDDAATSGGVHDVSAGADAATSEGVHDVSARADAATGAGVLDVPASDDVATRGCTVDVAVIGACHSQRPFLDGNCCGEAHFQ